MGDRVIDSTESFKSEELIQHIFYPYKHKRRSVLHKEEKLTCVQKYLCRDGDELMSNLSKIELEKIDLDARVSRLA